MEWAISIETAIEMEAQAQAEAFSDKRTPEFKGD
jgi:hypothetical protein